MKTALQHFNELPQPYGQMAIEETIRQKYNKRFKFKYGCSAILNAFSWSQSEMSHDFWCAIYFNLQHLESQSKQDKG